MKNKLLLGALLISIASLFTACSDDRDSNPTFKTPTEFQLNTPALADQYIQLSEENTVHLTWSQPNYGFNANATYRIQVGLVQADGTVKWYEKNNLPKYLEGTFTKCVADISGEEIAQAINALDGFETIASYQDMGFRKIAFRVNSILNEVGEEVPGTSITSNYVVFNNMAAYCAIKELTFMYVVGNNSGWEEPKASNAEIYESWKIWETEIGSNIYRGTFTMPAGMQFRFYKDLTGWDKDSWGSQVDDAGVASKFADGSYSGTIVKGKGTWLFSDFKGGDVTMTVDMKKGTVNFTTN
ncbi:MAG: SusE domain-containing protein [Bacteroidaceae bacterium]|nr:SusE domain-containing protein [Bacteroidaceae bacterium]